MKHLGNSCEFNIERDRELLQAFHRNLSSGNFRSTEEAFFNAATHSASRFWVSERRASYVVGKMIADPSFTDSMLPKRREMYLEIFRRFEAARREYPEASIYSLVFDIVNSPAPEFYLTPKSARIILYNALKRK